jgi:hypothetical protein
MGTSVKNCNPKFDLFYLRVDLLKYNLLRLVCLFYYLILFLESESSTLALYALGGRRVDQNYCSIASAAIAPYYFMESLLELLEPHEIAWVAYFSKNTSHLFYCLLPIVKEIGIFLFRYR